MAATKGKRKPNYDYNRGREAMSCLFTFHASITMVLTPAVKIVKIRRQSKSINFCPVRERQKMKAGKNVIGSNETMTIWEEKKEWSDCLKRIFSFQYRIIQSHNTPKQHIMLLYASHIVPTYCHICNLWVRVIFLQLQNWDTNIGAKGITCFISCWSPPHTHTPALVHTASNIGGKKLL